MSVVAILLATSPAWAESPASPKASRVGIKSGVLVPRADLGPGLLLGMEGSHRIWRKLNITAGVDWVRLSETHDTIVGPPGYPRAQANLAQQSDLFAVQTGFDWGLADIADLDIYMGAQMGMSVGRASLQAFSQTRKEGDVSIMASVRAGVAGRVGSMEWRVEGGWREATHDLGNSGSFAEETLSGLLLLGGIAVPL